MEREHTVAAETEEETAEVTLATGLHQTRWVKAASLLPGTPSIVRDATIAIDHGPILAVWVPSEEPDAAPSGTAFRLPPDGACGCACTTRNRGQDERVAKSDLSTVGLYFTDAPAPRHELTEVTIAAGRTFAGATTIAAIHPTLDRPYAALDVSARLPGGERVTLLAASRAPARVAAALLARQRGKSPGRQPDRSRDNGGAARRGAIQPPVHTSAPASVAGNARCSVAALNVTPRLSSRPQDLADLRALLRCVLPPS